MTRVPAALHERLVATASAAGMSLNQWVQNEPEREVMQGSNLWQRTRGIDLE